MVKGPAGYGRYDDAPDWVGCPFEKSAWSPCLARDGHLALAGDPPDACACCAHTPEYLAGDLAEAYEPARRLLDTGDPVTLADQFAAMVREATEPGGAGG